MLHIKCWYQSAENVQLLLVQLLLVSGTAFTGTVFTLLTGPSFTGPAELSESVCNNKQRTATKAMYNNHYEGYVLPLGAFVPQCGASGEFEQVTKGEFD